MGSEMCIRDSCIIRDRGVVLVPLNVGGIVVLVLLNVGGIVVPPPLKEGGSVLFVPLNDGSSTEGWRYRGACSTEPRLR